MATEWQQMDDYYWQGPPGWTICRVFVHDEWTYELWRTGDSGGMAGSRPSFEAAQALYEESFARGR